MSTTKPHMDKFTPPDQPPCMRNRPTCLVGMGKKQPFHFVATVFYLQEQLFQNFWKGREMAVCMRQWNGASVSK